MQFWTKAKPQLVETAQQIYKYIYNDAVTVAYSFGGFVIIFCGADFKIHMRLEIEACCIYDLSGWSYYIHHTADLDCPNIYIMYKLWCFQPFFNTVHISANQNVTKLNCFGMAYATKNVEYNEAHFWNVKLKHFITRRGHLFSVTLICKT